MADLLHAVRENRALATPRITIGLAVYNGEPYLASTIESLLGQTYGDFELLIADNASTDRTREIVEAAAVRDPRVRYLGAARNRGSAWNHNRLVEAASGEYFMWAGHDDRFAPTYLAGCVAALDADPSLAYVLADNVLIDEHDTVIGVEMNRHRVDQASPSARFWEILTVQGGHNTYGLTRTALMRRIRPHRTVPRAERIVYAELSLQGPFHVLHRALYFRRIHAGQVTNLRRDRAAEARILDPQRATWWRHQTPVLVAEYGLGFVDAIVRSRIPTTDKLRALALLARWAMGHLPGLSVRDPRAQAVQMDRTLQGHPVDELTSATPVGGSA
jgi:glycosyltransferase involved in cell wall biosynthesis